MVDVSEAFLQQFVTGLREAAASQQASAAAIAEMSKALGGVIVELREHNHEVADASKETREGRDIAVSEVKAHISAELSQRESWWRKMVVFVSVALVVANLIGVPLGRIIEALLGLKP